MDSARRVFTENRSEPSSNLRKSKQPAVQVPIPTPGQLSTVPVVNKVQRDVFNPIAADMNNNATSRPHHQIGLDQLNELEEGLFHSLMKEAYHEQQTTDLSNERAGQFGSDEPNLEDMSEDFSAQVREAVRTILADAEAEEDGNEVSSSGQSSARSSFSQRVAAAAAKYRKEKVKGVTTKSSIQQPMKRSSTLFKTSIHNNTRTTESALVPTTAATAAFSSASRPKSVLASKLRSARLGIKSRTSKSGFSLKSFAASTISSQHKSKRQDKEVKNNLQRHPYQSPYKSKAKASKSTSTGKVHKLKKNKSKGKVTSNTITTASSKINLRKSKSFTVSPRRTPSAIPITHFVEKSKSKTYAISKPSSSRPAVVGAPVHPIPGPSTSTTKRVFKAKAQDSTPRISAKSAASKAKAKKSASISAVLELKKQKSQSQSLGYIKSSKSKSYTSTTITATHSVKNAGRTSGLDSKPVGIGSTANNVNVRHLKEGKVPLPLVSNGATATSKIAPIPIIAGSNGIVDVSHRSPTSSSVAKEHGKDPEQDTLDNSSPTIDNNNTPSNGNGSTGPGHSKIVLAPLPKNPTMLDVNLYLARIQNYFETLGYHYPGEPKIIVNTKASIRSLIETAKQILKAGQKIKCLHALVLAIHLTNSTPLIERFPIHFKSKVNGKEYKHVVLGIYMYGHYGALGISRDEGLQSKSVAFTRLSDLLEDFHECYENSGHELLEIKIGGAITHDPHSLASIQWKVGPIINYTKDDGATVQLEADRLSKLIKVQMGQTCLRQQRPEAKVFSPDTLKNSMNESKRFSLSKSTTLASSGNDMATNVSASSTEPKKSMYEKHQS